MILARSRSCRLTSGAATADALAAGRECDDLGEAHCSSRRPNGFIGPASGRGATGRAAAALAGGAGNLLRQQGHGLPEGGALAQGGLAQIAARPSCLPSSGIWTAGLPPRPCSISGIFRPPGMPMRLSTMVVWLMPSPAASWRSRSASRMLARSGAITTSRWRARAQRLHLGERGGHRQVHDDVVEPPPQQIQHAPHAVRGGRGRPVERFLGRDQAQPLVDFHGDAVEEERVRPFRLLERNAQPADRLHAEHQRRGALPQMQVEQGDMAARGGGELQRKIDRHGGRADAPARAAHGDHAAAAGGAGVQRDASDLRHE